LHAECQFAFGIRAAADDAIVPSSMTAVWSFLTLTTFLKRRSRCFVLLLVCICSFSQEMRRPSPAWPTNARRSSST
jgi:hypothetical protein